MTSYKFSHEIYNYQSYAFSLKDCTHGLLGWSLLIFAWVNMLMEWRPAHVFAVVFATLSFPFGDSYYFYFSYTQKTRYEHQVYRNEIISTVMVVFLAVFGIGTSIIDLVYFDPDFILIYNLFSGLECLFIKIPLFAWFTNQIKNTTFPYP
jgi:hypothetical protein